MVVGLLREKAELDKALLSCRRTASSKVC